MLSADLAKNRAELVFLLSLLPATSCCKPHAITTTGPYYLHLCIVYSIYKVLFPQLWSTGEAEISGATELWTFSLSDDSNRNELNSSAAADLDGRRFRGGVSTTTMVEREFLICEGTDIFRYPKMCVNVGTSAWRFFDISL